MRYGGIVITLEKTKQGVFPWMGIVGGTILAAADRAHRLLASPGNEALRLAALEEHPLLRIDGFPPLRQQRRHPQRVTAVNPPGKGQEDLSFLAALYRTDFYISQPGWLSNSASPSD